jgi:hypothetical protein
MKIRILDEKSLEGWDENLSGQPYSTLQQTVSYGSFVERYYRARPCRIVAEDEGARRIASLAFHRIGLYPERYNSPVKNALKDMINRFNCAASWREGPIFYSEENQPEILTEMLEAAENIARRTGAKKIYDVTLPLMIDSRQALEDVFVKRGYERAVWATYMIDLSKPIEAIWDSLKAKVARTPVRKAESLDLEFKECHRGDIDDYYRCELEHGRMKKLEVPPKKRFFDMWDLLSPIGGYRIFSVARDDGALGYMPLRCFNKTVHIVKPVQSKEAYDGKIPAGDLLMWECIKWAKTSGFRYFDLAGVSPSPKTKEEEGIKFFKEKWGGDYYEYGVFSKKL